MIETDHDHSKPTGTTPPPSASAPAASRTAGRSATTRHHAAAARHRSRPRQPADDAKALIASLKDAGLDVGVFSRREAQPGRSQRRCRLEVLAAAAMTASSPSAAARRSMSARSSPSWPARPGRCGTSRTSATGGRAPTPNGIAPVVAVPTTAGTGSEVGRAGVITDEATHTKKVIFHPADDAEGRRCCDPELTVGMPPSITAGTGMDALAHCLEAYCAPVYHPMADGIARRGHAAGEGEPAARRRERQATSRRAAT